MERIVNNEKLYSKLDTREIAMCISGSDAYGTSTMDSDIDLRGYWVQKKEYCLGIIRGPDTFEYRTTLDGHIYDIVLYEIGHFSTMFIKSNPCVVEWVFNDIQWRYPTIMTEFVRKLQNVGLVNERSFYLGLFGWIKSEMKEDKNNRVKVLLDIMRICLEAEVYHHKHQIVPNIKQSLSMVETKTVIPDDYERLMELKKNGIETIEKTDEMYDRIMKYFHETQTMIKPDEIKMNDEIVNLRKEKVNELVIAEREDEYYVG